MKKVALAALILAVVLLLAPRPAAAHVSIRLGLGFPVFPVVPAFPVVVAPPCGPYYAPYPYPSAYPYPYAYPGYVPYGVGLHRYGHPYYFDDGWGRRRVRGYTLH